MAAAAETAQTFIEFIVLSHGKKTDSIQPAIIMYPFKAIPGS